MKHINNVFMYSLIKKLIIYLNEPTYFSKDSKNHYSNDMCLQKKYCNASQIIYRG